MSIEWSRVSDSRKCITPPLSRGVHFDLPFSLVVSDWTVAMLRITVLLQTCTFPGICLESIGV